ncbi:secreted protein [gut metagenome]|uniref:Secreted protein n=1 Tax=gut metagenome TaxID=749906 RepID=J9F3Z6_9ZZZZ
MVSLLVGCRPSPSASSSASSMSVEQPTQLSQEPVVDRSAGYGMYFESATGSGAFQLDMIS